MAEATPPNERTRMVVLLTALVIVSAVAAVRYFGGGGISGSTAGSAGLEYPVRDLPLLATADGSQGHVASAESSGNPFAFRAPPTPTPNLTPPPTPIPRPTMPPRPTPTPRIIEVDGRRLPPPPPFNREYIGYLGPRPQLVAAFRKGGQDDVDVEVAMVGDVLDDIYILRAIHLESVTIGYVGYPVSEDTSVPLSDQ